MILQIMSNKVLFWVGFALLVVAGIGYFNIQRDGTAVSDVDDGDGDATIVVEEDKEDIVVGTGSTIDKSDKTTIAAVVSAPSPSLDREILFESGISEEQKEITRKQVNILTDALKADPNRFNEWVDLGLLLKSVGDYGWARDAWEHAGSIRPGNSLSFANLGTLYGYYLGNPVKAEANLLHAIENEPRFLDWYTRTVDFYLEVMKDKERADDFLARSVARYPEWTDLKALQTHIGQ